MYQATNGATGVVYAVGDSIWKCGNFSGTQTWTRQTSVPTTLRPMYGVDGTSATAAYAVGDIENVIATTDGSTWSLKTSGTKVFDTLLTYKYLTPNVSHTLLIDAMIQFGSLKGYQKSVTLNIRPGKDTTVTPNSALTKCGYGGATPACQ